MLWVHPGSDLISSQNLKPGDMRSCPVACTACSLRHRDRKMRKTSNQFFLVTFLKAMDRPRVQSRRGHRHYSKCLTSGQSKSGST
jgi:hypothetical protein